MTQPTTPRFGDLYNYVQRQSGWGATFAAKTVRDSTLIGLNLKSRTTSTPPGSPANGDAYYLPVTPAPSGAWSGQGGKIAAYFTEKPEPSAPVVGYTPSTGYVFYTPPRGLQAVVQDEGDAPVYYNGTTMVGIVLPSAFSYKTAVRMATLINMTLSGLQTIDDVVGVADDRVLVKNQSTASQNGIYLMKSGAWIRATDADVSAEVTSGMLVPVTLGTINAATLWLLTTNNPITLDTTPLVFSQIDNTTSGDVAATANTLVQRTSTAGGNFLGTLSVAQNGSSSDILFNVASTTGGGTTFYIQSYGGAIFSGSQTDYSGGQHAALTFQPKSDASGSPDLMFRSTPNTVSSGDVSVRFAAVPAVGMEIKARETQVGSQNRRLTLDYLTGALYTETVGGIKFSTFDSFGVPTVAGTIGWDGTNKFTFDNDLTITGSGTFSGSATSNAGELTSFLTQQVFS